jgi:hypothetical protein
MSRQPESLNVEEPFTVFMEARGWKAIKLVGNAFQCGLPDHLYYHPALGHRFVEFKHFKEGKNTLSITKAQRERFPDFIKAGMPVYCIATEDIRGVENKLMREHLYSKLFKAPNLGYLLNTKEHYLLR